MCLMRRKTAHIVETKLMVQTNEAIAGLVLSYNDKPMTDEARKNEEARVDRFVKNPDELRKKQREEHDNRERQPRTSRHARSSTVRIRWLRTCHRPAGPQGRGS